MFDIGIFRYEADLIQPALTFFSPSADLRLPPFSKRLRNILHCSFVNHLFPPRSFEFLPLLIGKAVSPSARHRNCINLRFPLFCFVLCCSNSELRFLIPWYTPCLPDVVSPPPQYGLWSRRTASGLLFKKSSSELFSFRSKWTCGWPPLLQPVLHTRSSF